MLASIFEGVLFFAKTVVVIVTILSNLDDD